MVPFERLGKVSYSHSIVIMAVYCIVSEIELDIGRKSRFFILFLHSTPLLGGPSHNIAIMFGTKTLEWCGYVAVKIEDTLSTEYRRVSDGRTDGHTDILRQHSTRYA